jgi:hypothetical protein
MESYGPSFRFSLGMYPANDRALLQIKMSCNIVFSMRTTIDLFAGAGGASHNQVSTSRLVMRYVQ